MIIKLTHQFNILVYTFIISNYEKYLPHFAVNCYDKFSFRVKSSFKDKSWLIIKKEPLEALKWRTPIQWRYVTVGWELWSNKDNIR